MRLLIYFIWLPFLASCDMPACKNGNPIFDNYQPDAIEYKRELLRQLRVGSNLRYWIDKYDDRDEKAYMSVFIQGDGLCAKGILDITHSRRLEQYRAVRGVSYSGAELSGLSYRIDTSGKDINFVFEDVKRIID